MRGRLSAVTPAKKQRVTQRRWWGKKNKRREGVVCVCVCVCGGARTLTVNYLEYMAIRAAMSVSVIWSLETCHRIHSTDNLLKASQLLSAQLCPLWKHSAFPDYSPWYKFLACWLSIYAFTQIASYSCFSLLKQIYSIFRKIKQSSDLMRSDRSDGSPNVYYGNGC